MEMSTSSAVEMVCKAFGATEDVAGASVHGVTKQMLSRVRLPRGCQLGPRRARPVGHRACKLTRFRKTTYYRSAPTRAPCDDAAGLVQVRAGWKRGRSAVRHEHGRQVRRFSLFAYSVSVRRRRRRSVPARRAIAMSGGAPSVRLHISDTRGVSSMTLKSKASVVSL
jgi:hypothetical protein